MNDLTCRNCGHSESVHRSLDIFLYECLYTVVDGGQVVCSCKQFGYMWQLDDLAAHSDTCEVVDCPADHENG